MKNQIEGYRKDRLKHVNLSEIIIGERFREDLGDLDSLVEAIREKGIIQPVSLDANMNLLAGGRRCAAAQVLGLPTVPAIIRDIEDEVDARELELMENVYRKDFNWQEQCKLVQRINDLYLTKTGGNWSGRKTAELLDKSNSSVNRSIQLAEAMKIMPELGEMKTADDALKMLKKLEEGVIVAEMRKRQTARVDESHSPEAEKSHTIARGQLDKAIANMLRMGNDNYMISDTFSLMSRMKENGNIQIIECDPPYGIDLNQQKASKDSVTSTVSEYNEIHRDIYPNFLENLTQELYRIAGKDCWLVFWYGHEWQQTVFEKLKTAGWNVDLIPAVWTKTHGQTLQPELYFARGYEPFLLCRKGKPVMVNRGRLNVFDFPGVTASKKYHPTQRPRNLIVEIFQTLAAGTTNVYIPFLGSGESLLACYELGFRGFGSDLDARYKDKFMLAVEEQVRGLFDTGDSEGDE